MATAASESLNTAAMFSVQVFSDYEIALDAEKCNRFSEFVTSYNYISDKTTTRPRPRVLVEVFYTTSPGIRGELVKRILQEKLDPDGHCL